MLLTTKCLFENYQNASTAVEPLINYKGERHPQNPFNKGISLISMEKQKDWAVWLECVIPGKSTPHQYGRKWWTMMHSKNYLEYRI